jgi:cyanophycinase-like exopeptidase
LVLAGGGQWQDGGTDAIDGAALGWSLADRPMAVLSAAGSAIAQAEGLVEYYNELGGPTGYVVPIFRVEDAYDLGNCELLAQAGLIYVHDGPQRTKLVETLDASPALEALGEAFEMGATVVANGDAASAFGSWVMPQQGKEPVVGWGWVLDTVIEPFYGLAQAVFRLRQSLSVHPDCLGLGIPASTALALGPDGRVDTLGDGQVTVTLGQALGGQDE